MRLRKSSLITKLVLLAIVIYSVVAIASLQPEIAALRQEANTLAAENAATAWENQELQRQIDTMWTDESILRIARERLHLVLDGEIIFIDTSNSSK